ncbi:MAG: hypothetical protein KDD62_15705, partial [Bdellovibrionales bacterium]|nr:hypothetical protein [Bdellovibrionales bacterium]
VRQKLAQCRTRVNQYVSCESLYFVPAAFFFALGLCTLLATSLVIGLLAGFSIFLGIITAVLAWKFIGVKKKFENILKQLDGKVLVHSMHIEPGISDEELIDLSEHTLSNKKVTYH